MDFKWEIYFVKDDVLTISNISRLSCKVYDVSVDGAQRKSSPLLQQQYRQYIVSYVSQVVGILEI